MNTDHPTTELYFVFALTYCKLRVYDKQEAFAQRILDALVSKEEVETMKREEAEKEGLHRFQEIDTRLLLELVSTALPSMLRDGIATLQKSILEITKPS
jgi:hypothetical protein